jgi:RNA recognition motif-containing protein
MGITQNQILQKYGSLLQFFPLVEGEYKGEFKNKPKKMNLIDLEKRFPYDKKLSIKGKELRKNMTEPERRLWFRFFKSFQQTYNIRVLKQRPIHNFIVDFYISQFKLVIEID